MDQSKGMRLGALLAMMLIVSMAFVPAVSAAPEKSDERKVPKELTQWKRRIACTKGNGYE